MYKKRKLFGNNNSQTCGDQRAPHSRRHGHGRNHNSRDFQRSSRCSCQSFQLRREPLDNISDPKFNKTIPMRRLKTHLELGLNREKTAVERSRWLNLDAPSLKVPKLGSANIKSSDKLLVNVTVWQSSGALRVIVSTDTTVLYLIKTALTQYCKERRRPILSSDPLSFCLHYSQFTLDCLNPNDKIKDLDCRSFFLCPKNTTSVSVVSCGVETVKMSRITEPWENLINCFLLLP